MRLIDAEKLWLTTEYEDGREHKYYEQFEVEEAPTIDAEPVVRCKDCKHRKYEDMGMVYCESVIGGWTPNDWFCADGEKKEK